MASHDYACTLHIWGTPIIAGTSPLSPTPNTFADCAGTLYLGAHRHAWRRRAFIIVLDHFPVSARPARLINSISHLIHWHYEEVLWGTLTSGKNLIYDSVHIHCFNVHLPTLKTDSGSPVLISRLEKWCSWPLHLSTMCSRVTAMILFYIATPPTRY